jgi:hypothetical protein
MGQARDSLVTLTHARLRLAQGDTPAARRLLLTLLERDPRDREAQELLATVEARHVGGYAAAPAEEELPPPEAGDPVLLAGRFRRELGSDAGGRRDLRIRRLALWLRKVTRHV